MSPAPRVVDIILKKKSGQVLSAEEISFIVRGYAHDQIPDYQVAAWLMAVCWRGMDEQETTDLTLAMAHSGDLLDLHDIAPITVDKHSTGGVGDKTSLVLAPLVASCGLTMAKMSGRGLGFSGGTIDKLESIPGFRAELPLAEFRESARRVGLVVTAQSLELAPADKKLYALRDVTGTVDSLPLIASSIMSKKLAAGSDCIALDVKVGRGAFMPNPEEARALAELMVRIARRAGRQARALLSNMDQPLGMAVGNALELKEAIHTLHGDGPPDLVEVCMRLGSLLLAMAGRVQTEEEARQLLQRQLDSGAAWDKFCAFVANQGGNLAYVEQPERLPHAQLTEALPAPSDGYIADIDARLIAQACLELGAGRATKETPIDPAVGVVLHHKVGDLVARGESLLTIHASDAQRLDQARQVVQQAFRFSLQPVPRPALILGVV